MVIVYLMILILVFDFFFKNLQSTQAIKAKSSTNVDLIKMYMMRPPLSPSLSVHLSVEAEEEAELLQANCASI